MKKLLFIPLILNFFASKSQCLKDSSYNFNNSTSLNFGLPDQKGYYTYEANGNHVTTISIIRQGSVYVNGNKSSYTYNQKKKITEGLFQNWNSGNWQNASKGSYTYSAAPADTILTAQLWQAWDNNNNSWFNSQKVLYTYTDALHPSKTTESVESFWHQPSNNWRNSYKDLHMYYPDGKEKQYIRMNWDTTNSTWVNSSKTNWINNAAGDTVIYQSWQASTTSWLYSQRSLYVYNFDGTVNQLTSQNWNGLNSAWENAYHYNYAYAGGHQTEQMAESWDVANSVWKPFYKNTYTFDSNGNVLTQTYLTFNNGAWTNNSRSSYTYGSYNESITYRQETWNTTTNSWAANSGSDSFYNCQTGTGLKEHSLPDFKVYPNPGSDLIFIKSEKPETITIFNISGTVIGIHPDVQAIDIRNLSKGVYFLQNAEGRLSKFIKQ